MNCKNKEEYDRVKALNKITDTNVNELAPYFHMDVNNTISSIYEKYHYRLQSFLISRLSWRDDADDVEQEVYLRLIQHQKLKQLTLSFALMRKIAGDLVVDRFRKGQVRKTDAHIPMDDIQLKSMEGSPEDIAQWREDIEMVEVIFDRLGKKSKQAFILHRFRGLTYEKIAKEMGISRSMVQRHISHVLLELNKKFRTDQ